MERIKKLFEHPVYQDQFQKLQRAEQERIFCRHTLEHFLDVARLMYIYYLEDRERNWGAGAAALSDSQELPENGGGTGKRLEKEDGLRKDSLQERACGTVLSKELIYAAALLHDIGRFQQISRGIPHDRASAAYAREILPDCDFDETEIKQIEHAILCHRDDSGEKETLSAYLYRADKKSRCCFACPAAKECNWSEEKKNHQIIL